MTRKCYRYVKHLNYYILIYLYNIICHMPHGLKTWLPAALLPSRSGFDQLYLNAALLRGQTNFDQVYLNLNFNELQCQN